MAIFAFAAGLVLRRGEQLLEFRRRLENGDVQFEDPLSGRIYAWPLSKVYRDIQSGELLVFRGDEVESMATEAHTFEVPLITNLESLPKKFQEELERRLDYINACRKQGLTRGRKNLIKAVIQKTATRRNEKAPAVNTVMTWWRKFEENGMSPMAIVSGNTKRRRPSKIPIDKYDVIKKILKAEYFTRARHPLTRAHILINAALKQAGPSQENTKELISLSSVRRIAEEVSPYYRDVARFGPAYAKNKWRYSLQGTTAQRVLERVEVDHTKLDLVVVCDRSCLPLGRPTITVVIDAYSGYVLSFFVSFWGTGLGPTLSALKIAITPKDKFYEGNNELSLPWLGYGLSELIVVDNGLEFHSAQFKMAAWYLNADIQYCAVRQPWLKPSIERTLGTLELYIPAQGKVHKPLNNYLPPNPRETASITFSQLCNGLLKYFVDILPLQANQRTLIEPYEVFKEGFERLPPPLLPSSFNEIELIGAFSKKLTVGNEGVVFEYLRYNSPELQNFRRNIAHTFTTMVKLQPENLNFVYVQEPVSKSWLLVPSCQPDYTAGLSIVQHRAIRRHLKNKLNQRQTLQKLMQGKAELIDLYRNFLRGNQGKRNVEAAQKFGALTSTQTLVDASIQPAPPVPETALVVIDSQPQQSKIIPDFETFILD